MIYVMCVDVHLIRHVSNVHDVHHVCTDAHAIRHVCTDAHAIHHVCTDAHVIRHVCICTCYTSCVHMHMLYVM